MKSALLLLLCGLLPAQQQAPPVIHVDVNLVQVDAVVTDSKNRHVSTLKAEDFVVLQDGQPQTITNFSYIASPKPPAPPAAAVRGSAAVPVPAVPLKPAEVRRTYALVVDDLAMPFESIAWVRDALRKFVDHQIEPGDLVAIVRTSGGSGVLQQFTSDKTILHAAIDHVRFTVDRSGLPALATLRFVIDGLRDLPGRKSVVLFSQNMALFDLSGALPNGGRGPGSPSVPVDQNKLAVHSLVDAANRASTVIYTIDPRGVIPILSGGGRNPNHVMAESNRIQASREGLWTLAEETGGLFIHDQNALDDAISQALADSDGYYLIGYHPDSATFNPQTGDPKFHSLQVRLKTPGLHIRSRSGFFGQPDALTRALPRTGHDELMHALVSPFTSGAVPVRLTAMFEQAAGGQPLLAALLSIDARSLQFTPQPGGGQKATLEVVTMTFGPNGLPVDQTDRSFDVALDAGQFAAIQSAGLVYRVNQPLQHPGVYQMHVALRDQESGQLGSASQFIEAPDLANGRLAISSLTLAENPSHADDSGAEGRAAATGPIASAAQRIFHPGAALSYQYTIFNAQGDAAGKTDLAVETRIFHDGKPVYQGQPMSPQLAGQTGDKHLAAGGNMVLSNAIPPGDYVLQIIVTDRLARPKYQTVSQWMDFQIQP